ncbi:hypothetical protein E8E13_003305 [Curvularia kusanoi]|uniref:GPI inositol-deacylase winged helix domain-containing protein n=1 Tax=Curvularia kusanoi TaxID=90978 RepID=A0A9P4T4E6_CURKU|nr:hypothetical protein E8E13_003305 [Curvularia kusanoi]
MLLREIPDAADGMFLLARLHVDSLLDKRRPKDVKIALTNLKKGAAALNIAYEEALRRIDGQLDGDRELAKRVIAWITYAKRPLTITEMCIALAVEPERTEIDPDNLPDSDDIVSVCAGLVIVDHDSAFIRLVHYTTQEYFERHGDTWMPDGRVYVARTCLTYLRFDAFESGRCTTWQEYVKRLQEHQFLDYAAKHWGDHSREVETEVADQASLFLHSGARLCATQILQEGKLGFSLDGNKIIHDLASFGLAHLAKFLARRLKFESNPKLTATIVNSEDVNGDTPLSLAAEKGHFEMVQMLLDHGADVNDKRALSKAARNCDEKMIDLMLSKGANAATRSGAALLTASREGHHSIVEMLLNNGDGVDGCDTRNSCSESLFKACDRGHEQVVKVLLEKGVRADALGDLRGGPLYQASRYGRIGIVELLLNAGAHVNLIYSQKCESSLWGAICGGHTQISKILREAGAKIVVQAFPSITFPPDDKSERENSDEDDELQKVLRDNKQKIQLLLDASGHPGLFGPLRPKSPIPENFMRHN